MIVFRFYIYMHCYSVKVQTFVVWSCGTLIMVLVARYHNSTKKILSF